MTIFKVIHWIPVVFRTNFEKLVLQLTPDREPMTEQCMNTTKVQFGEPSFIGITYRNVGEGLLTGAEMTQTNALPKHTPIMSDSSQKLGS